jgi:hypothetical protein
MWPWKKKEKPPFVPYLEQGKFRIVEAFDYQGVKYLMFENAEEVPTARLLAAQGVYCELEMRCDREYLDLHCRAVDKILNENKKGINVTYLAQLNMNLRDRLALMPLPDFVYKLASVIFFDESESKYSYDWAYNQKKIAKWKEDPQMLDFFLNRLATELIPSLKPVGKSSHMFFQVAEKIDKIHRDNLTKALSPNI